VKRAATVLLLFLLWGCATQRAPPTDHRNLAKSEAERKARVAERDRRFEILKPSIRAYYACNKNASRIVATQAGELTSLAIGARSTCRSEEDALYKEAYAAFKDVAEDPTIAKRLIEKFRKQALENNRGDIVGLRAANTPSGTSETPSTAQPLDR
jgi:hypothetical protein